MEITEKDIKKIAIFTIIGLLAVLVFILIKPVIFAIISGLVLAYIFHPVYIIVKKRIRSSFASALILVFLVLIIILVPMWFITPLLVQQIFEIYRFSQTLDVQHIVRTIFPTATDQFTLQLSASLNSIVGTISSSTLNSLVNLLLEIPTLVVNILVIGFVFFYALKDSEEFRAFVSELSPINKNREKYIVNQFKGITDSIVYGTFIVGIAQGILTGIGLLVFGVNNALVLTGLATFFSIIPILGPYIIWIPVALFLFNTSTPFIAFSFLLYNLAIVSTADNFLRAYIVSKKTDLSSAIVLIGMIAGLLVFGIIGLLLGPLILAYFLVLLRSYREKNLYSLFAE